MNGAPANPISGVDPSAAVVSRTASTTGASTSAVSDSAGCSARSRATSSAVRTAEPITGPTPGWMSTSTPARRSGMTMSEKKIAASTPCRRTGCRVISDARSGVRQASSIAVPFRASRYSGSDRPAWRMNHTGRRPGVRPRYASTSGACAVRPSTSGWSAGRPVPSGSDGRAGAGVAGALAGASGRDGVDIGTIVPRLPWSD